MTLKGICIFRSDSVKLAFDSSLPIHKQVYNETVYFPYFVYKPKYNLTISKPFFLFNKKKDVFVLKIILKIRWERWLSD